jgi:hypothetical protein
MNSLNRIFKRKKNQPITNLVQHWDKLEALVIRVFKGKTASPGDLDEYRHLRAWLLDNYMLWEESLEPYWRASSAGGEPVQADPFRMILSTPGASGFVRNWKAMQTLPAAREALNSFMLDQPGES